MPQTESYDSFYSKMMIGTELKFAWLPETCYLTGKRIWLEYAYRMTRIITDGPEKSIFEYRWHDKNTHIMWMLKR
jgi:hypothetical protein